MAKEMDPSDGAEGPKELGTSGSFVGETEGIATELVEPSAIHIDALPVPLNPDLQPPAIPALESTPPPALPVPLNPVVPNVVPVGAMAPAGAFMCTRLVTRERSHRTPHRRNATQKQEASPPKCRPFSAAFRQLVVRRPPRSSGNMNMLLQQKGFTNWSKGSQPMPARYRWGHPSLPAARAGLTLGPPAQRLCSSLALRQPDPQQGTRETARIWSRAVGVMPVLKNPYKLKMAKTNRAPGGTGELILAQESSTNPFEEDLEENSGESVPGDQNPFLEEAEEQGSGFERNLFNGSLDRRRATLERLVLKAHVDRAPQITPEFGEQIVLCCLAGLAEFLQSFQSKVEQFHQRPGESGPPTDSYVCRTITLVNCCPPFREYVEKLVQFGHPESNVPRRQANAALDKVTRLCNRVLAQQLFEELRALVNEVHRRVLVEYVRPLLQVRLVCSSNKMRGKVAARLEDEGRQLQELFGQLKSTSSWLNAAVPHLAEILRLGGTPSIQMEVGVLVRDFPDVRRKHVAALLDVRGLRGQGQRQEILAVVKDLELREGEAPLCRERAFFSDIPATRVIFNLPGQRPMRIPRGLPCSGESDTGLSPSDVGQDEETGQAAGRETRETDRKPVTGCESDVAEWPSAVSEYRVW
ncbi:Exocyst complex component 3-like protein 2 [Chelonia mydas]|uniref:Exocyst complex component 3-like protein 2 n=1 Tax=Chelonia mydas TaxID=8469 RepID=M7B524_CHEMY|nr:Exocyst complex component 3-like protein 2 [Chelonia mydas]